jgi:hypothetical protein
MIEHPPFAFMNSHYVSQLAVFQDVFERWERNHDVTVGWVLKNLTPF